MAMQIKYLAREGMKKAAIARQLSVSRQTVYNHLQRKEPFPGKRRVRASKLDPYKEHIRARLERFDLPATVLLRELAQQGYRGGLTILREYVRPLKEEFIRRVTERFETLPGQQAQMDWGECGTIEVAGERKKLYVFVVVLGYSRMMYARFTTSSRLPVLLRCLKAAFRQLGIPAELLVDNMKQAVDQHEVSTGIVRWNKSFLQFANHHDFLPVAAPPYWPRVRGKVERGVGYVKTSFLEGRAFVDLDDLNGQLEVWLDTVANVRVHGTTKARPVDRHGEEMRHLRPMAGVPVYDVRPVEFREVPSDCHISYDGIPYSVDPQAVGRTVMVRPEGEDVGNVFSVYLGDVLVARHQRRAQGHPAVTLPEHAAAIQALTRGAATQQGRRRGRAPRFEQLRPQGFPHHPDVPVPIPAHLDLDVQIRSLDAYEELLTPAAEEVRV